MDGQNNHVIDIRVEERINAIPTQWRDFLEEKDMLGLLRTTLQDVYKKHLDDKGNWRAAPEEVDIFNWMSCPPREVRAIILLKEPLIRYSTSEYISTGYAFGVKRMMEGSRDISIISTVWKLFEILHLFKDSNSWNYNAGKEMKAKYNTGFNPEYLSTRGILFLNHALTKRDNCLDDTFQWFPFFTSLMEAIGNGNEVEKIPVIQFYNNKYIEKFLAADVLRQEISVYQPEVLKATEDKAWHLAHFDSTVIKAYVEEIKQPEHRDIMKELAEEIISGYNCVA